MLTLPEFITTYMGATNVGDTPENRGQCVGLIEVRTDNLGLSHTWGNASQLLADANLNDFEVIPNTPEAIIQAGDIPVWDAKYNGNYGHTGIATGNHTDVNQFECFEQNDPLGSFPHLKIYSYAYVDGWLRPKVTPPTPSQGGTVTMSPTVLVSDVIKAIYRKMIGREIPDSDLTVEENKITPSTPFSVEDTIGRFMSQDFLTKYDLHTSAELKENYEQGFANGQVALPPVPEPVPAPPVESAQPPITPDGETPATPDVPLPPVVSDWAAYFPTFTNLLNWLKKELHW